MKKKKIKDQELTDLEARLKALEDEKKLKEAKDKARAKIRELEREKTTTHKIIKFIKNE